MKGKKTTSDYVFQILIRKIIYHLTGTFHQIMDWYISIIYTLYYASSFLVRNEEFHDEEFLARKSSEENEELTGLKKELFRGKNLEN